jgi:hypothetical protein
MGAATPARAPSGMTWGGISWADVQRQVRRLQARTGPIPGVGFSLELLAWR